MEKRLNIKEWAPEDRPREKMMRHGVSALTNAELLAILIGSGNAEESAVELMRKVMKQYHDNLNELGKCDIEQLCRFKGIGQAKAVSIMAALELGKRRRDEKVNEKTAIRCSKDIYQYFYRYMADLPIEECWVMMLNQAMKVIDSVKISAGGLSETSADVRCILREAILKRATAIALCHNHPSGSVKPSVGDEHLTERLEKSAQLMNIKLLDHVVLADGCYYSFADEGRL